MSGTIIQLSLQLYLRYLARDSHQYTEWSGTILSLIAGFSIFFKFGELGGITGHVPNSKVVTVVDYWNFLSPLIIDGLCSVIVGLEASRDQGFPLMGTGEVFEGLGDSVVGVYLNLTEKSLILTLF